MKHLLCWVEMLKSIGRAAQVAYAVSPIKLLAKGDALSLGMTAC